MAVAGLRRDGWFGGRNFIKGKLRKRNKDRERGIRLAKEE